MENKKSQDDSNEDTKLTNREIVMISLPTQLIKRLDKKAKDSGTTRGDLFEALIEKWMIIEGVFSELKELIADYSYVHLNIKKENPNLIKQLRLTKKQLDHIDKRVSSNLKLQINLKDELNRWGKWLQKTQLNIARFQQKKEVISELSKKQADSVD